MIHDNTQSFSANSVQPAPVPLDSSKAERFALSYGAHGNAARAYRESFDTAGMLPNTIKRKAYELVHSHSVAARVRELRIAAAEQTTVSLAQQITDISEMLAVDVAELWSLTYRPCSACLTLYDADLAARRTMPDLAQGLPPHVDCRAAQAHQHVAMLPVEAWSPAARRLFNGFEMQRDGTLRPTWRDRNALQDQLNKLLAGYTSKSINVNTTIPQTGHVSPRDAARMAPERLLDALGWRPSERPASLDERVVTVEATQP